MSTQFKNRSNIKKCLMQEKLVKPVVPKLTENHTVHDKRVLEYRMGEREFLMGICIRIQYTLALVYR